MVFTGIVIELFKTSICDPNVCAIPTPNLLTLNALFTSYICRTFNISVPTLNEEPTETEFGILETKISSTLPLEPLTVICFERPIISVEMPTENDPVKLIIDVFNPEIEIESLSFNSINGR